jgi:hypothetical protein
MLAPVSQPRLFIHTRNEYAELYAQRIPHRYYIAENSGRICVQMLDNSAGRCIIYPYRKENEMAKRTKLTEADYSRIYETTLAAKTAEGYSRGLCETLARNAEDDARNGSPYAYEQVEAADHLPTRSLRGGY